MGWWLVELLRLEGLMIGMVVGDGIGCRVVTGHILVVWLGWLGRPGGICLSVVDSFERIEMDRSGRHIPIRI